MMPDKGDGLDDGNYGDENFKFPEDILSNSAVFESKRTKCAMCKVGDLRKEGNPTVVILYTRSGVVLSRSQFKRCNFRNGPGAGCRAGHGHGYYTSRGVKIYEDDTLKNESLMVSKMTGFDIEFLVEAVGSLDLSNDSFEAMAAKYNRFHHMKRPTDVMDRRVTLMPDRLKQAVFLFMYLEFSQRYGIKNYQVIKNSLAAPIMENRGALMAAFCYR